jgi:dTDP-4-amino-4,6-dideoxygalactose transaminase
MIHFNKPFIIENELKYIEDAIDNHSILRGDGVYTKKCHALLEKKLGCKKALLTHSCTAALEMAAILLDLKAGDEVIMPSYTFVSTANAFVLRGAVPIFVDIRPDTLNIDENLIEKAITPKTKAICCVHYAGVACEMDKILDIARRHNLYIVEDAAQALGSFYKGKPLGTIGDIGCFSFHETKNVIAGEGGAIIINNEKFIERAEIIREKGTNRSKFFRGQVDKYTWVDIGSSYLPSDMIAAFLYSQLENMDKINKKRLDIWGKYDEFFKQYDGIIRRPIIPQECQQNAHMYYVLFNSLDMRTKFIEYMKANEVITVFHYIPLHSAPAGQQYCKTFGNMDTTNQISDTLVRLPLFYELDDEKMNKITKTVKSFMEQNK